MSASRHTVTVDLLVEEGLTRYGRGDFDGAMAAWEDALALDPEHPQAHGYVDYVRLHYDQLTGGDGPSGEHEVPFGLDGVDEPGYQVEILPGTLVAGAPARPLALDDGWFMDDELGDLAPPPAADPRAAILTLELEADEPPDAPPGPAPAAGADFDDATSEYLAGGLGMAPPRARPEFGDRPDELTLGPRGFDPLPTPTSPFGSEVTDVRNRRLGFVQPQDLASATTAPRPAPAPAAVTSAPPTKAVGAAAASRRPAPELLISLRTPADADDGGLELAPMGAEPATVSPTARTRELGGPPSLDPASFDPRTSTKDLNQRVTSKVKTIPDATPRPRFGRAPTEEEPTTRADLRDVLRAQTEATGLAGDQFAARLIDELDRAGAPGEDREDRARRRITTLIERATEASGQGDHAHAVVAAELALSEDSDSALVQKLLQRNRDAIQAVFQQYLGNLQRQPTLARPLHELASAPIGPRAAFLLSRIDGMLSIDEVLDVSGMPRLEAYRHLCQLFLHGILR